MMRLDKYEHLIYITFFCLGHSLIWANNIGLVDTTNSDAPRAVFLTDSTISKEKKLKASTVIQLNNKTASFNNSTAYYTNLRKDVSEAARREKGNSVSTNSFTINNRLIPSTLSNVVSFNIYDKQFNVHSFSGTQSTMQPLTFTFENTVNTKVDLFGFEYRFKRNENQKLGYQARFRFERDHQNRSFYQLGLSANYKRDKGLNFVGIEYFPVRSGPGHMLNIYRTQFSNYNEFQLTKKLKQLASVQGNYYSDRNADFIALSRTEYRVVETSILNVSTLMEGGYGLGSIDRRDAYPYWMAEKRMYGGAGIALGLGSENTAFQMFADASVFGEVGQASFERYTGSLSYQIKNFSTIYAGLEVYTIEDFYSNFFQLGMVYSFK